jgi:hypothetical protein
MEQILSGSPDSDSPARAKSPGPKRTQVGGLEKGGSALAPSAAEIDPARTLMRVQTCGERVVSYGRPTLTP